MTLRTATALLLTCAATPLLAQTTSINSDLSGWIELEHSFGDGDSENLIAADVTLKVRPASMNGIGFDLGVLGAQGDDFGLSSIYATVVVTLGGGELSFGVPRSALREIFGSRSFAGSQLVDVTLGVLSQSDYLTPVYLLSDAEVYGLRYDNTYGSTRVSAGLYKVEDATTGQVAMEYALSNTKLQFGLESLSGGGITVTNLVLGAVATMGKLEMSGMIRHLSAEGGSADTLRLGARYAISDAFVVSADYFTASEETPDVLGLSVEYGITKSAYVQGGVVNADGSNLYDLSLGVKF